MTFPGVFLLYFLLLSQDPEKSVFPLLPGSASQFTADVTLFLKMTKLQAANTLRRGDIGCQGEGGRGLPVPGQVLGFFALFMLNVVCTQEEKGSQK